MQGFIEDFSFWWGYVGDVDKCKKVARWYKAMKSE